MEGAEEGDDLLPSGVVTGQFECRFDRLGSRICEEDPLGRIAGRNFSQLHREVCLGRIIEIGARHVHQLFGLMLNGRHDTRMAVPGRTDGNARREIEKQIPVDVLNDRAFPALHRQRIVAGI